MEWAVGVEEKPASLDAMGETWCPPPLAAGG